MVTPVLSILVLGEDSSLETAKARERIARELVKLVVPGVQTHRVDWEPARESARLAAAANRWRSSRPEHREYRVALARSIATKLLERDGYVFFHVDADCTWTARTHPLPIVQQFEKLLVPAVRAHLAVRAGAEVDRLILRLLLLLPHYSIEAWLYQSTSQAVDLCRKHHRGKHVDLFVRWGASRGELDEVSKPKDSTCLHDRHNSTLAEHFPAPDVAAVGKSFAAAVRDLHCCEAFVEALQRTALG